MSYDHRAVEAKWLAFYERRAPFYCDVHDFSKPKYYVLDMFPYPSGQGLHVGHPEGYTASDIVARMKRMQGYLVLHPMGWDAFGLPAEQFAIKSNRHPGPFTKENIDRFRRQIKKFGFSYDWSKEISTADPKYYKWTQWIFRRMFLDGLAYESEAKVNYCPALRTVLANEEVVDGKSERGGFPVIKMPLRQWMLRITSYADRLLAGLKKLDWPRSTKEMQANWIGKSEGAEIIFDVADSDESFTVFTTRADTLFGCTYCVLAPEHPLVKKLASGKYLAPVLAYLAEAERKSDLERTALDKEKTGVFLGAYAINPIDGRKVPIYVADYVLYGYGSGAVMAVPAHDERDYEFAKKHGLPMIQVLEGDISKEAMVADAPHVNSAFADGLDIKDASEAIINKLIEIHHGRRAVHYKLRDWLFSRQRYWGEPFPLVRLDDGTVIAVPEEDLPVELPALEDYSPGGAAKSPLARAKDWLDVTIDGKHGMRETDTMPQWAGSCWYYIRYLDPHNGKELADPELIRHWLPVDLYVGGAEHAVLHLLYARFWHKYLEDIGVVFCDEPFRRLFHQGMILGENGEKMSKSRGNVINPDDIIAEYGADALRLFEMFAGPLEESFPWSTTGIAGARRFIERVWRLFSLPEYVEKFSDENDGSLDLVYNQTVKKVTEDYERLQMNTAIAQLMIFVNALYKADRLYKPYLKSFLQMFSCVCPFVSEELYRGMTGKELIDFEPWPSWDESKLKVAEVKIAAMVNGRPRATVTLPKGASREAAEKAAKENEAVKRHLEGKEVVKVVFVPDRIINFVVRQ